MFSRLTWIRNIPVAVRVVLVLLVAGGVAVVYLTQHHKVVVVSPWTSTSYNGPLEGCDDGNPDTKCLVLSSSAADGVTVGPIPYDQTYDGNSGSGLGYIRANDYPRLSPDQRCDPNDPSTIKYDGNFFGERGTVNGTPDPTWYFRPPTNFANVTPNRPVANSCKNDWNIPLGSNNPLPYYRNADGGYRSPTVNPANFMDPGHWYTNFNGPDFTNGVYGGWARDLTYTGDHNDVVWRTPDAVRDANDSQLVNAKWITCHGCQKVAGGGRTFLYRNKIQITPTDIDLTQWSYVSGHMTTFGNDWSVGWIDSNGAFDQDGSAQARKMGCGDHGVCNPDEAGPRLEAGQPNGFSDLSMLADGREHVLGIQTTDKRYNDASVTSRPELAYTMVLKFRKSSTQLTIGGSKEVASNSHPAGGNSFVTAGSQVTYRIKVFAGGPVSGANPVNYTLTETQPPGCADSDGLGFKPESAPGGVGGANATGTLISQAQMDTWLVTYTFRSGCATTTYTNTVQVTSNATPSPKDLTASVSYKLSFFPWIQTQFGDVHSNTGGVSNTAGHSGDSASYIVSGNGIINNFNSKQCFTFVLSNINPQPGNGGSCPGTGQSSYGQIPWPWQEDSSFFTRLNAAPDTFPNPTSQTFTGGKIYKSGCLGGYVTLNNIKISGAVTLFVPNCGVIITGGITDTTPKKTSALAIMVGGVETNLSNYPSAGKDVIIDPNVTRIESTAIVSTGTIYTGGLGPALAPKQLIMTGLLAGMKIDVSKRTAHSSDGKLPAEQYNYLANFTLTPPPGFINLRSSGGQLQYSNEDRPAL